MTVMASTFFSNFQYVLWTTGYTCNCLEASRAASPDDIFLEPHGTRDQAGLGLRLYYLLTLTLFPRPFNISCSKTCANVLLLFSSNS